MWPYIEMFSGTPPINVTTMAPVVDVIDNIASPAMPVDTQLTA